MTIDISEISSRPFDWHLTKAWIEKNSDGVVTIRLGDLIAAYSSELMMQMPDGALSAESDRYAALLDFLSGVQKVASMTPGSQGDRAVYGLGIGPEEIMR